MKVEGMRNIQPAVPLSKVSENKTDGDSEEKVRNLKPQDKQKDAEVEKEAIDKAVKLLNKTMESYNTELQFTLHKDSGEYMVKVVNTSDHTVIREIPPERVLDMVAHFKKMLGIIVDKFI